MFSFAWPWAALSLPLPWLVSRLRRSQRLDSAIPQLRFGRIEPLSRAGFNQSPSLRSGQWLLHLLWLLLVLALMQPQNRQDIQQLNTTGYDLMLAVDLSESMRALDFTEGGRRVSRLAVTKGVVSQFIAQRSGDRIGLVLFGESAYLQAPLTLDVTAVQELLQRTVVGMAGSATAVGDALALAVKKLRERPENSRVVILLTDGENTAGVVPPLEAARLAARYGVRVYTIGVGSEGRVPYPDRGGVRWVEMGLDEALLQEIAGLTGGGYFRATDSAALRKIYNRIDELEQSDVETRVITAYDPLFRWPLGGALILLAWLGLAPGRNGMATNRL
ncbi:MAG: VWA domain-containing protein [Gammaproteobacteria bacterium]|nr:VWA domain-containing protein [Gammaproteobacteria bacterium]